MLDLQITNMIILYLNVKTPYRERSYVKTKKSSIFVTLFYRLDLSKVNQYSISIFDRRRQHIEEEVAKRLKKEKEAATKFVIFVDGGTTKVISKGLADRLLNWAKGKRKLGIEKKALSDFTSLFGE